MTGRAIFMQRLKEVASRVSGGRYFVKRGYINWGNWNFDTRPAAMSLMLDEHQILSSSGMMEGVISIECFARMDDAQEVAEIDDVFIDRIITDIATIIDQMEAERFSDAAYPVAFAIKRNSAKAVEAHDAEMRIQGVTATFEATF